MGQSDPDKTQSQEKNKRRGIRITFIIELKSVCVGPRNNFL